MPQRTPPSKTYSSPPPEVMRLLTPLREANPRHKFNWVHSESAGDLNTQFSGRIEIQGPGLRHQASVVVEALRDGNFAVAGTILPHMVGVAPENDNFRYENGFLQKVNRTYGDGSKYPRPKVFSDMVNGPVSGINLFAGQMNLALTNAIKLRNEYPDLNPDLAKDFAMPYAPSYTRLSNETGGALPLKTTYILGATDKQAQDWRGNVANGLNRLNSLMLTGSTEVDGGYKALSFVSPLDEARLSGFTIHGNDIYKTGSAYNPAKDMKLLARSTRDRYITPGNSLEVSNPVLPTYNRPSNNIREMIVAGIPIQHELARKVGLGEGRIIGSRDLLTSGSTAAPGWDRYDLPADADLGTLKFAPQADIESYRQATFANVPMPDQRRFGNRLVGGWSTALFGYTANGRDITVSTDAKGYQGRVMTDMVFDLGTTPLATMQSTGWLYGDKKMMAVPMGPGQDAEMMSQEQMAKVLQVRDDTDPTDRQRALFKGIRGLFEQRAIAQGLGSMHDGNYLGMEFLMPGEVRRSGGAGFRQNQISYRSTGIVGSGDVKNIAAKGVSAYNELVSNEMHGNMVLSDIASINKARGILQQRHDWSMNYDPQYAEWYGKNSRNVTDFLPGGSMSQDQQNSWWGQVRGQVEQSAARWRRGEIAGLSGEMQGPARLAEIRKLAGSNYDESMLFPIAPPNTSAEWTSKSSVTIHDLLAEYGSGALSTQDRADMSLAFMRSPHFGLLTAMDAGRRANASTVANFQGFQGFGDVTAPQDKMRRFTDYLEREHGIDRKSLNPLKLVDSDGNSRYVPHPNQIAMLGDDRQAVGNYLQMVSGGWNSETAVTASDALTSKIDETIRSTGYREGLMKARTFGIYNTFSADPTMAGTSNLEIGPSHLAQMIGQSGGGIDPERFLADNGLKPGQSGFIGKAQVRRDPALGDPVWARVYYNANMPAGPMNVDAALEQAMGADSDGDSAKVRRFVGAGSPGYIDADKLGMLKAGLANLAGSGGLDFTMAHLKKYGPNPGEGTEGYLKRIVLGIGAGSQDEILNPILGDKGQNIAVDRLEGAKSYDDVMRLVKPEDMAAAHAMDVEGKHNMGIFNMVWTVADTMSKGRGNINAQLGDKYAALSALTGKDAHELLRSKVASWYQIALDKQKMPSTLKSISDAFNYQAFERAEKNERGGQMTDQFLSKMYSTKHTDGKWAGQYMNSAEEVALMASGRDHTNIGEIYDKVVAGRAAGTGWSQLGIDPNKTTLARVMNASVAMTYRAGLEKGKIKVVNGVPMIVKGTIGDDGEPEMKPVSGSVMAMVKAGEADPGLLHAMALRRRKMPDNDLFLKAFDQVGGDMGEAMGNMNIQPIKAGQAEPVADPEPDLGFGAPEDNTTPESAKAGGAAGGGGNNSGGGSGAGNNSGNGGGGGGGGGNSGGNGNTNNAGGNDPRRHRGEGRKKKGESDNSEWNGGPVPNEPDLGFDNGHTWEGTHETTGRAGQSGGGGGGGGARGVADFGIVSDTLKAYVAYTQSMSGKWRPGANFQSLVSRFNDIRSGNISTEDLLQLQDTLGSGVGAMHATYAALNDEHLPPGQRLLMSASLGSQQRRLYEAMHRQEPDRALLDPDYRSLLGTMEGDARIERSGAQARRKELAEEKVQKTTQKQQEAVDRAEKRRFREQARIPGTPEYEKSKFDKQRYASMEHQMAVESVDEALGLGKGLLGTRGSTAGTKKELPPGGAAALGIIADPNDPELLAAQGKVAATVGLLGAYDPSLVGGKGSVVLPERVEPLREQLSKDLQGMADAQKSAQDRALEKAGYLKSGETNSPGDLSDNPLAKATERFTNASKVVQEHLEKLATSLDKVDKVTPGAARKLAEIAGVISDHQAKQESALTDMESLGLIPAGSAREKIASLRQAQSLVGSAASGAALNYEQGDKLEEALGMTGGARSASGRSWGQRLTSGMYLFGMMRDFRMTMQPMLQAGEAEQQRRQMMGSLMLNVNGGESLGSIYGPSYRGIQMVSAAGYNMQRGAANIATGLGSILGSGVNDITSNPFLSIGASAAGSGLGAAAAVSLTGSTLGSAALGSLAAPVGLAVAGGLAYSGFRGWQGDTATRAAEMRLGNQTSIDWGSRDSKLLAMASSVYGNTVEDIAAITQGVTATELTGPHAGPVTLARGMEAGWATLFGGDQAGYTKRFSAGMVRQEKIQQLVAGGEGFGQMWADASIYNVKDRESILSMAFGSGMKGTDQFSRLIADIGSGQAGEDAVVLRSSLGRIMSPTSAITGGIANPYADSLSVAGRKQYLQNYESWGDQIGWRMGLGVSSAGAIEAAARLAQFQPGPGMQLASQQGQSIATQMSMYGGNGAGYAAAAERFAMAGVPLTAIQSQALSSYVGNDPYMTSVMAQQGRYLPGQDWRSSTRADIRNPGYSLFQNSLSGLSQNFDASVQWNKDAMGVSKPFIPDQGREDLARVAGWSNINTFARQELTRSNPLFADMTRAGLAPTDGFMSAVTGQLYAGKGGIEGAQEYTARLNYGNAMAGVGLSYQEASLAREQELTLNRPQKAFQLGLQQATQFGGMFGGYQFTGSFNFQQQELNFSRQTSQIQYGRAQTQFGWEAQGMQLGRQETLLGRGAQSYDLSFQQVDLQLGHQYFQQDWGLQQNKRQLQFGWQMEDSERTIRRATGFEKQQAIRERGRAVEMFNLDSVQLDREKQREETKFKREEERWNVQRRRFDEQNALEDKRWALEQEQFKKKKEWTDEDFKREQEAFQRQQKQLDDSRKAAEMQYAKEQERFAAENKFADKQYELQVKRIGLQAQEITNNETLRRFVDSQLTEQKTRFNNNMDTFETALVRALNSILKTLGGELLKDYNPTTNPTNNQEDWGAANVQQAAGGNVVAGRAYVVGDGYGPEIFVAPANGKIIPNTQSKNPGVSNGGNWNVSAPVNVVVDGKVIANAVIKFGSDSMRRDQKRVFGG